jgi:hypothetical protein
MARGGDPVSGVPTPDLPVGTVVTIGHPGNGHLAVHYHDGWRNARNGAAVDPEDFRAGWAIVGPQEPEPRIGDEFCHHTKGPNGATVPPCLRTLDDEGRCPIHGANIHPEEPSRA